MRRMSPGIRRRRKFIAAGLVLATLGIAWGWAQWRYPLPNPDASILPTLRLFAGDEQIAVFQGISQRSQVWVPLARIPRPVVDAVLVTEDRRFLSHWGIDFRAVLRAVLIDLRHGKVRQGGSTITQQLSRTLFLGSERTWGRKLHESFIALLLEVWYPKDRILEAYLNSVYMGTDGGIPVFGLGAAARHFLDKDLADVRLDEAALLAAAISGPNRIFSGDAIRARAGRDGVLLAMRGQGVITDADARQAIARPVQWRLAGSASRAPYFVELAREEIARRASLPPSGEVRITTSLDLELQRVAEAAVRTGLQRIERRRAGIPPGELQAALVAMEPATGEIRALVGGRGFPESPFNRATRARRQPGSLFKPIVYLAAFEAEGQGIDPGLTPASLIADAPMVIRNGNQKWSPRNMDHRFRGSVTVRRALEESLNVPTIRVAQEVGLDRIAEMAQALGIESPLAPVPSLALGTSEVTLLEVTTAFATLANQGVRVFPTALAPGSRGDGSEILPATPPVRVVSAESSFLVTHILRGVMRDGTGRASAGWGLSDVTAGKTGTTDSLRDAWFVGYTPDLVVGVWVGRDDGRPLGLDGAQAALPIWASVMQAAVRRAPPRPFTPPPGVVLASIDRDTGRSVSFWCRGGSVIEEAFRAGTEPSSDCDETPAVAKAAGGFLDWLRNLFR
jgi:penicillin-binding protein 1B